MGARAPEAYAAAADATLAAERAERASRHAFFTRATPAAAQKAAAAHAQRQGDLGTLRGEQLGLEGEAQANDCMRMSKFTAAHEACVRRLAPCICCVLCVGCSAEAGSHSSRPHSSPTLIVQERQSFCHMANGTLQAFIGRNL